MGWKFNPFTGQLDQAGSGGGGAQYIDGEVQYYADLSLDAGVAALNSAWLVREASGAWPLTSRKPAGIYIRTATGGTDRDADYTYAGVFPDVFSDANFTVYNEADATKNVKLDASGVTTGTTRLLTVPNASGTISLDGHTHDIITSTSGVNKFKLGLGGDSATGRFTGVTTAADPLVGVLSYANEASYNASGEVASSRWGMTLGANSSAAFVQYLKNGSVQATYTLPSSGGTVALTGDAPAAHTHGNIANDGTVGATAGLPLKTGSAGVVEVGAFGTSAGQFAEGNHTHDTAIANPAGSDGFMSADDKQKLDAISGTNTGDAHTMTSSDHSAGTHKVFYSDGSGNVQELALGAANTVLTSNGAAAAPSFAAAGGGGATNLWIAAASFIPKTTAGCGVDSRETATNDQNFDELLFDAGSDEFADALVVMPSNYNNGTVTARFYWTASTGSGDVVWGIKGRAFANDDALDTAAGTAQTVTDTLLAADDMHVSAATSAVTIGGTPAANTPIQFTIYRDADAAGDTIANDTRLLGVEITFS